MEGGREGDILFPLISSLLCLCVLTGGIFLVLYVYLPNISQPWFPILAFILIGSPWIFWFLTYLYTCMKACCRAHDRPVSRRYSGSTRTATLARTASIGAHTTTSSQGDGKHEYLSVVVTDGEDSQDSESHQGGENSSTTSSRESGMPLTYSVSTR
ncbi:putative membrane lipoprotein [Forsythia ovata]|uniref:Membrane lipoprotein n=1 Tax=Forsythia ovata TaxID=205694 RepID=A0ABD1VH67_9LAMI